jgi:polysaccharide export outer membrane protein
MRPSRLAILLLVCLTATGCMRRGPRYYAPPQPMGPMYAQPIPAQPRALSQPVYAQPAPASIPPAPAYTQSVPLQAAPPAVEPPSVIAAPAFAPPPQAGGGYEPVYALDAGDRLRIQVFGQEGLTNSYTVDAAGNINLSLIGAVPARGYTTQDLARAIADRLRNGYIREPSVTVEIEAYRPFFILGEVTAPGQYPYVANMTVETAVAIAGGFGARAKKSSVQITRVQNGATMRSNVPMNFPLKPGDTVSVAERWF